MRKTQNSQLDHNREKAKNVDMVNRPPHYTMGRFEVIDVLEDWAADDPHIWTTLKYLARYKHKGAPLQDLEKARWYLDRKIAQLKKNPDTQSG